MTDNRSEPWILLDALREAGWIVACHNDYRIGGELRTFWLFTHPNGQWIKGEGRYDSEALTVAYQLHQVMEYTRATTPSAL